MSRSLFSLGFQRDWFSLGTPGTIVGPTLWHMNEKQARENRKTLVNTLPVPPGMTVAYPYIVKVPGFGEYVVNADQTATWFDYAHTSEIENDLLY